MNQIAKNNSEVNSSSRLLRALQQARTKLESIENQKKEPIAIVGIGCRLPGSVNNPEDFWHLLRNGVDAITEISTNRWDVESYYHKDPNQAGKMYTRYGGFLDEVDKFDPSFFNISPREAGSIDPQQRLLLEVSWEALENAGLAPDRLNGSQTGVFIGVSSDDYSRMSVYSGDSTQIDAYSTLGNARSIVAGRLSYFLGLHGPSLQIDTACSSSLLGVHLACQSLRNQECDLALAGGVNLILSPEMTISLCKLNALSTDGRCKTFDAAANGYVRGEGCGIIVLKRLSAAIKDKDRILGVIRGSAVNHDGSSNGLTAPNGSAQEDLIRQALENADVKPSDVQYVEAHGTGTSLGDPIEVLALNKVLSEGRSFQSPLLIGSVKTNIGHLESAAGVASLIKVVLALQNRQLPPHLHLQTPNPYIPWDKIPVDIPANLTQWPEPSANIEDDLTRRRLAAVSAFGLSGTNVHMLLEEAPEVINHSQPNHPIERPLHLLTLSAKSNSALQQLAGEYEQFFADREQLSLPDVSFTANVGRVHFQHRLAIVASSIKHLREQLQVIQSGQKVNDSINSSFSKKSPQIVFLFTGQGSQYIGMGRQLYETQPTFRQEINRCDKILHSYLDKSLLEILYPAANQSSPLNETAYTQPTLFALEYALAKLWISWGIEPTAVMGHSVGEYVAACLAGVFSLEDGLKLIAKRGELLQSLPSDGEMVAVFASASVVARAIRPYTQELSIAAINGPNNVVISGKRQAVRQVVLTLKAEGIKTTRLSVSHAFHSPLVEPLQHQFLSVAKEITYSPPRLCFISNVSGEIETTDIATPEYWWQHLRQQVKFAKGMEAVHSLGYNVFIEIGSKPTLLNMSRRCMPTEDKLWLPSLNPEQADWQQMLQSLGKLYVRGVKIDWFGFDQDYPRYRLRLPTYPWQRSRYWFDKPKLTSSTSPLDALQLWHIVESAGLYQSQQAPLDLAIHTYPTKYRLLTRLATAYIIETFSRFGVYTQAYERHSVDSLLSQLQIQPSYHQLLFRWLKHLTHIGLLKQEQEIFVNERPLPSGSLETLLAETRESFTDASCLLDYFECCGNQLTAILTGQQTALETLFPGGSLNTAEYLYQKWPVARYFNGIASRVLESVVRMLPANKPLRILEVGAGTGGTTAFLLPFLPQERTQYYFTDLSDFFFVRAKKKFKAYPFVQYGILNIEQPIQNTDYHLHSFDVIVATNVLHATKNLDKTLEHVRSLLVPGGLLLLNEVTNHAPWFDISTGLIEGWQRFEDSWRKDNPLLSREQWEKALQKHGFERTAAFPGTGEVTEVLGQHLIVAQAFWDINCTDNGVTAAIEKQNNKIVGTNNSAPLPIAPLLNLTRATLTVATPKERQKQINTYLCQQIARILGLAPTELVPEQSLYEIGFDSLMAVELRHRIEADLEVSMPTASFFQKLSINAFSDYLLEQLQSDPTTSSGNEITNQPSYSLDLDEGLIPIQTNGSKPPLVCIHPGGLDVSCYHNLARYLDPYQPLYALQPLDLDHYRDNNLLSVPAYSIQETAARCLKTIQELQPKGPYRLGGWSLGGCVAFEIAQQLRQQGHKVALLALLDVSNSPPNDENLVLLPWFASYLGARRYQELPLQYETLSGLSLDQQLNSVLQMAIKADLLAPDTQLKEIHRLFSAYRKGVRASLYQVQQYHLQPYPEPITVCQASKTLNQFNITDDCPQQLWNQLNQLSAQRLKTYTVPGDHYTMWLEPHVQTLAQILQHSLDQIKQNELSSLPN